MKHNVVDRLTYLRMKSLRIVSNAFLQLTWIAARRLVRNLRPTLTSNKPQFHKTLCIWNWVEDKLLHLQNTIWNRSWRTAYAAGILTGHPVLKPTDYDIVGYLIDDTCKCRVHILKHFTEKENVPVDWLDASEKRNSLKRTAVIPFLDHLVDMAARRLLCNLRPTHPNFTTLLAIQN